MDIMSYLMGRNSSSAKKGAKIEVVTELPETGEPNVIYLVPKQDEDENNVFDEYLYVNDEWELIGSTAIDISGKQDTMQFSTMPSASAETVGKIVQYIGTTDANYTNGYFYVCVSETENNVTTYSWSNVEVQDISNYLEFEKKDVPTFSDSIMLCKLPTGFYEINGYCHVNQDFSPTFRNALVSVYILYTNAYIWIWNKNTSKVEYYSCFTYGYGSTNDVKLVLDVKDLATKNYTTSNMFNLSGLSEYKTTTTYQINDYVYRLDSNTYKIYKCNTADTKGTWNASKWNEKTYMEYLSDTLVGGALNGSY